MDYARNVLPNDYDMARATARFMSGVYRWMLIGIALTAGMSYMVGTNEAIVMALLQNIVLFYALIFIQFGLVLWLSARIRTLSVGIATGMFLAYATLTGVTFSILFMRYTQDSIFGAFISTACGFAGLSAVGYVTKRDLGPVGTFCQMGLWGLIGYGLVSMFFPGLMGGSNGLIYSMVGVIVFAGLTAYDTQKIKAMSAWGRDGSDDGHRATIMGALTLYLDFINLFLMVLRLSGNRRR